MIIYKYTEIVKLHMAVKSKTSQKTSRVERVIAVVRQGITEGLNKKETYDKFNLVEGTTDRDLGSVGLSWKALKKEKINITQTFNTSKTSKNSSKRSGQKSTKTPSQSNSSLLIGNEGVGSNIEILQQLKSLMVSEGIQTVNSEIEEGDFEGLIWDRMKFASDENLPKLMKEWNEYKKNDKVEGISAEWIQVQLLQKDNQIQQLKSSIINLDNYYDNQISNLEKEINIITAFLKQDHRVIQLEKRLFDIQKGDDIEDREKQIEKWVIDGYSIKEITNLINYWNIPDQTITEIYNKAIEKKECVEQYHTIVNKYKTLYSSQGRGDYEFASDVNLNKEMKQFENIYPQYKEWLMEGMR